MCVYVPVLAQGTCWVFPTAYVCTGVILPVQAYVVAKFPLGFLFLGLPLYSVCNQVLRIFTISSNCFVRVPLYCYCFLEISFSKFSGFHLYC